MKNEAKVVWVCTDMEGLSGVDSWEQCYDPDDNSPAYLHGREQLTADLNAAAAGCFDAGATKVCVLDGHGRNNHRGFIEERLDKRVEQVRLASLDPVRMEGLDANVDALVMVGQHAMAGTLNGFLDHTQMPKVLCRFLINGVEHGEMSQFALYGGHYGLPLVHVSGDEALGEEARLLFPQTQFTATKRGTGWATCELYPPDEVRRQIRHDVATAFTNAQHVEPWKVSAPIEVTTEWAWSELADKLAVVPGVQRINARTVRWRIADPRDIYSWPSDRWHPLT